MVVRAAAVASPERGDSGALWPTSKRAEEIRKQGEENADKIGTKNERLVVTAPVEFSGGAISSGAIVNLADDRECMHKKKRV